MTPKNLSAAIAILSALSAAAQTETTTLIIPIYNQTLDYVSGVLMIETQGRRVKLTTEEYTETGQVIDIDTWLLIKENSIGYLSPFYDIALSTLYAGNGWARIRVPKDRKIQALFSVTHQKEPGRSAGFIAAPPAKAFRLSGRYDIRPDPSVNDANADVALSIVNPTDEEQTVTVTFHRVYPRDSDGEPPRIPRTIQGELQVPAMHRVSRFLSELVPIREKYPEEHTLDGVIRIEGETEISVAALKYFWNIPRSGAIPVVAETGQR